MRRYSGTSIRHSLYAEDGRWLGEYGDTGVALQQVIWLDDLLVGLIDGAGAAQRLLYIEPDHLGSPRAVIDPVRNRAVWKWDIKGEAFGHSAPNEDPDLDSTRFVFDMRFPGQRYDSASRLHYNYYRDGYDAAVGRYTQSDPIGLAGGINTYLYALGSPLLRVDPMGLQAIPLPVRPPLPIVPPHGGGFGDEAGPDGFSDSNVIPFSRFKSNDTCPPDNDCMKRKAALMGQHFSIDAQAVLEYARGVYDYALTAKKLLWNRNATEWNATCGPLGYPVIESVWFYELGPRKL